MIRLKYSQFMSFPFTQSMQKLANQSFPARTAYAMKKLGDDLQKQRNQISKEYLELVDGYATKNADGSLLKDKNDPGSFDIAPEKIDAYQAAEKDFGEREFVLDRANFVKSYVPNWYSIRPKKLQILGKNCNL